MKIKSFQGGYDKNLCYLVWCDKTNYCSIIDPSVEINSVLEFIECENLILDKIIITHTHHDHIRYLDDYIFLFPLIKVYMSEKSPNKINGNIVLLDHNDVITIGENMITALYTPGHYVDSICYWSKENEILFTGDTMFVGRTGRIISKGSNISDLYNSIYNIILQLPQSTIIYPGHHYGFSKTISIFNNIKYSSFFRCNSLNEFKIIMKNYENNRK